MAVHTSSHPRRANVWDRPWGDGCIIEQVDSLNPGVFTVLAVPRDSKLLVLSPGGNVGWTFGSELEPVCG